MNDSNDVKEQKMAFFVMSSPILVLMFATPVLVFVAAIMSQLATNKNDECLHENAAIINQEFSSCKGPILCTIDRKCFL